jgi:plasmid stabilization system protein ParE
MLRKVIYTQRVDADILRVFEHYEALGVPTHGSMLNSQILRAARETLRFQPGIGRQIRKGPPPFRAYLIMRSHWLIYTYDEERLILLGFHSAKEFAFSELLK